MLQSRNWNYKKIQPLLIWAIASLLGLFTFTIQGTPSVMIPELMQAFNIDITYIGILSSSFFYTYIVMQIPSGLLIDIYGPRRIIVYGTLICTLSIFWFAYSTHFYEVLISRMVIGFALSPMVIITFCLITRWFNPLFFPLMISLSEFIGLLGGIAGEGGIAKFVLMFGWKRTMAILGFISLFFVFLSYLFIHDYPDHDQSIKNVIAIKSSIKKTVKDAAKIFRFTPLWINGIYAGLVFCIFPAFGALWSIPYFMERYKIKVDQAALLSSTFFLGACIGTPLLGWISIYIQKRRPLLVTGTFLSFIVSLFVIYPRHVDLSLMYCLVLLLGFFSSIYTLSFSIANSYVSLKNKGITMGFTNMLIIIFGAPLLQPIIGFLLKWSSGFLSLKNLESFHLDNYLIALTPLPICLFLAFILAFFIKEGSEGLPLKSIELNVEP